MATFPDMIKKARRRNLADRALRCAGWGLLLAMLVGLSLLALQRLGGLEFSTIWYWVVAGLGTVAGVVYATWTQPELLITAVQLDRSLRLKDRIGTAASIDRRSHLVDQEFAEYVRAEADRFVGRVDVRAATPIRITGVWFAATALAAMVWTGSEFLPVFARSGSSSELEQINAAQIAQQQHLSKAIAETLEAVPRDLGDDETPAENIDAITRLAQQMNNPASSDASQSAREESAARLDELANQLAQQAERDQTAMEELTRRFQRTKPPAENTSPIPQDVAQALRKGEWNEAARRIDELIQRTHNEPSTQRRLTAEQLRQLAKQLEEAAAAEPDDLAERAEQLKQALRDQDLDEQTADRMLTEPRSTEALEQELRRNNIDPELAHEIAKDAEQLNRDRQAAEQANKDVNDVRNALDRAAQEVENPKTSQSRPPASQPEISSPQSATQPESNQNHESQRGNNAREPDSQPSEQPTTSSSDNSERATDSQDDSSRDEPQQTQGTSDSARNQPQTQSKRSPQPAQSQPAKRDDPSQSQQERQQTQPLQQQPQQSRKGEDASRTTSSGEQRQSKEQSPDSTETATQPEPGKSQREPSSESKPGQTQSRESSQPRDSSSPSETLRRLAERMQKSEDQKRSSERMRELARELMENSTPEERQRWMEQWKQQNQQPQAQRDQQGTQQQPPQSDQLTPEQQQRMLEQFRESGQEMWDKMSPEERQRMIEQMHELKDQNQDQPQDMPESQRSSQDSKISGSGGSQAGDQPPTGDSRQLTSGRMTDITPEDIDLRGNEMAQQPIMQWLNKNAPATTRRGSASENAPQVQQAQEVAERAVEDSTVQKRYHKMIKRYFGRLNQTIDKASSPEVTPATQPGR